MNPNDIHLIVDAEEKYVSHTFSKNKEGLSMNDLIEMTVCYIKNAYFANGNLLKRQSTGLAIGGHPSMQIANLYCAGIEWEHVERLITRIERDDVLKKFLHEDLRGLALVFRYVDDRLSPKPCRDFIPTGADYKMEISSSQEGQSVSYIGFKVTSGDDETEVELADKQEKIPFYIRRYPHAIGPCTAGTSTCEKAEMRCIATCGMPHPTTPPSPLGEKCPCRKKPQYDGTRPAEWRTLFGMLPEAAGAVWSVENVYLIP